MTFKKAHEFTSRWEGGLIDHKNDPGGVTNYGISLRWLKDEGIDFNFALPFDIDHNKDGVIDAKDVRALTKDQAAILYRVAFWDKLKLNELPPMTAFATYDAAVNTGRGQAVKFLQRACNNFSGNTITSDGIIGPRTISRVKSLAAHDRELAVRAIRYREDFHNMLAVNSPYADGRNYKPFIKGWLNRTSDAKNYVDKVRV
jgi:lysozyme family protein